MSNADFEFAEKFVTHVRSTRMPLCRMCSVQIPKDDVANSKLGMFGQSVTFISLKSEEQFGNRLI